ncbi:conserved hypothetical protein [Hyella patelloides LEGE 07179]|uniref:Uncharacterized protein n=1 Tax=Hyella patelloides LEGE 07179 TaxID=945734 RepID=A0A563VXP5_9CYAN|nr:hypothetical protein [Hyella patelloides]VEP16191.1 conserved hypothetical protein [Hyella patelloides LEGE 07179]
MKPNRQSIDIKGRNKLLKYLPYVLLSFIVFGANSGLELNYFVKGYISLIELQVGILLIYFITSKFKKHRE